VEDETGVISRRDFVKRTSMALAAVGAIHPLRTWAQDSATTVSGKDGMILRSFRFLDLEMPPEYANAWITPVPHFFVRNHMHEPTVVDPGTWKLNVSGEVENPLTLSVADLTRFEMHTVVNTLECAGNGRAFAEPHVPGIQWAKGAVGTARFRGARLRDILHRAGVKPTGKDVMFHGLDEVPGKVPPFIRSIPLEKALDEDTLIATQMNGAPLTKHHGYPMRAMVPGWIGAASCKWLAEIKVLDKEFEGNFMSPGYRMPNQPIKPGESVKAEDTHPVTALMVKSLIAAPGDTATLKSHSVHIQGMAWAGEAEIAKVEVSTDGGASWKAAALGTDQAKYAWRLWSYWWKAPKPGDYVLMSRATDSQGRIQPEHAAWNPSGYLNNSIDQVKIHVEG
jgi:DMSO/TMAO reductase YedYZ molybdopterin-dependent catalytic subunit